VPAQLKAYPLSEVRLPFLAADRAAWTTRSTEAAGRTAGPVVEVAIGSGAVGRRRSQGHHLDCFTMALSDADMAILARAESRRSPLPDLAAAMATLREHGVPLRRASRILGLSSADGSRLHHISALPRAVLDLLRQTDADGTPRFTLNHARWILGVAPALAIRALASHRTVRALRAWRRAQGAGTAGPSARPEPAPAGLAAALLSEGEALSAVLGAKVRLGVGEGNQRTVRVEYGSVETLQGVLEKMLVGHGEAPPYPNGAPMRTLQLSGVTDAELAFLLGSSSDR
jgi:hypothetical protein